MPSIRQVSVNGNQLSFTGDDGVMHTFTAAAIPVSVKTGTALELYLNTVWLPPRAAGKYQIQVHVFTFSPLQLTVGTWNLGDTIPLNWWADET